MRSETTLGRLGEKALNYWATQAGATINPAIEDEHGWDFLLEFEPEFEGEPIPLDKTPHPIKCWIQVKSTDSTDGFRSVKLKNWLKLIKTPYPAFFLVLEFDNAGEPQRAFLVHVGETHIAEVQKRLRSLGNEKYEDLHKYERRFRYSDSDQIELNGASLKKAIFANTRNGLLHYAQWKQDLVENVGYNDGGYEFSVMAELPSEYNDPLEFLVDHSLGLIPHIETQNVEIRDMRFGIQSAGLTRQFDGTGTLEFVDTEPFAKGEIILCINEGDRRLKIDCEVYIPIGFGFELESKYRKILFRAKYLDFIVLSFLNKPNNTKVNFHWPEIDEVVRLKDLYYISHFIVLIREAAQNGDTIDVQFNMVNTTNEFHVKAQLPIKERLPELLEHFAILSSNTWVVAKYFDLQDDLKLTIKELSLKARELALLSLVMQDQLPDVVITYHVQNDLATTKALYVDVIDILIDKFAMITCLYATGTIDLISSSIVDKSTRCRSKFENMRIEKRLLVDCSLEAIKEAKKSLLQSTIETRQANKQVVLSENSKRILGLK